MSKRELLYIPVAQIRENPVALRTVKKESEDYLGLVDSIKQQGILSPISVRPGQDEAGNAVYTVIDGLQRFTAAQDAGLKEVPAQVIAMEDADVLEAQVIANIHKVETRPVEYSRQLVRILAGNPTLTANALAAKLGKSSAWVTQRLSLQKLTEKAKKLVDSGAINLSNAFALSKLPEEDQDSMLEAAQTETPAEFVPKANERKRQIDKNNREGRDSSPLEFTPTPHLRTVKDLVDEHEGTKAAGPVCDAAGARTALEGFKLGIAWAIRLDAESVAEARKKFDEQQARHAEKKEKAKAERQQQKVEDAKINLERVEIQAKHAKAGTDDSAELAEFDAKHGLVNGKRPRKDKEQPVTA